MKYSDNKIDRIVDLSRKGVTYPDKLIEIIEQLRAELAEAKRENVSAWESSDSYERNTARITIEHENLQADIERKRARIAALASREMGGLSLGYTKCLRDILAILDDKETPHA